MRSYLCDESIDYEPSVTIEDGLVVSWGCRCMDFEMRQLKKEVPGKCKHILKFMTELRDNLTSEVKNG